MTDDATTHNSTNDNNNVNNNVNNNNAVGGSTPAVVLREPANVGPDPDREGRALRGSSPTGSNRQRKRDAVFSLFKRIRPGDPDERIMEAATRLEQNIFFQSSSAVRVGGVGLGVVWSARSRATATQLYEAKFKRAITAVEDKLRRSGFPRAGGGGGGGGGSGSGER
ncbi:hypothetical protein DFJ73DRAFT_756587 [Zopfochytrium polystomum]|nr:hypothetical protein DFJ73DRAFT_756587 [Zopfochytrium polystomum]